MKRLLKRILPTKILDHYGKLKYSKKESPYYGMKHTDVFEKIYNNQEWGKEQTVSGAGSTLEQTHKLIPQLETLFDALNIQSVLDLPCGDFHWMQNVDLKNATYIGADIVPGIIQRNVELYGKRDLTFLQLDILTDQIPEVGLILNRDCLVHFSYAHIAQAIENIKRSGATYLMTTTFPKHTVNHDITTGDWRPINLQLPPFNFPKPSYTVQEHWEKEYENEYKGKLLAVWEIDKL